MNASCALQHFCDVHGPQVLLSTETRPYIQDSSDTEDENLRALYSQYFKSETSQARAKCKSCTISSEDSLVTTVDTSNHLLFITSPSTPNKDLFKDIRNACVRSLNIEQLAEVDHPILFGDDENGYCLALRFSCKDFHARGSQRLYSLCYLSRDKYCLLSLMTLITECMRQAVHWLQFDANQTYEQEGRVKVNTNSSGSATATYILRPAPLTPSQRMLSDIVRDSKLIFRLHALSVWILRTANGAINESLFHALPTEEQATKDERKDAFSNDVMNNSVISRGVGRNLSRSISNPDPSTLVQSTLVNDDQNRHILAASLYSNNESSFGNDNGYGEEDDFASLQYQYSTHAHEAFRLLQVFVQKLNNNKYLQYILYNWTIGNRLILKYKNVIDSKELIQALTSVFRLLIPEGCFQLLEVSNQMNSCNTNFLLYDTDLILDHQTQELVNECINEANSIAIRIIFDDIDDPLRVVKLESLPSSRFDNPIPTYVKSIVEILMDTHINEDAFESMIIQLKTKYLNKAKLYFQLGRCSIASSLAEDQQMKITNIANKSDLLLVRFWQKGLSQAYRKQIRQLKQDDNQQKRHKLK